MGLMSMDDLFVGQPAFERRAYMLDVSRDRVPRLETLEWLLGILADLRFNELQLYVEHTFAYTGHDVVWREASAYTHDDMQWLARRAADQGIVLVANMNGFGHMGRWLEHDEYRQRAECPDGAPSLMGDGTMAPTCLAPTPENAQLAVELATEMLAAVGGTRVHIGGDEPFELGDGQSAVRAAEVGRGTVYLEHLNRIMQPLVEQGNEVMFWADQFRLDPALMQQIPEGAIGVVWTYEGPSDQNWLTLLPEAMQERLGMPADANLGFVAHARLFVESGTPFWVAPGTSTWNTIIGRNRNAAANIADAVQFGAAEGAAGFLLTDWGDNGHWQPLAVSLPSLVRAAVGAWSGEPAELDVGLAIDQLLDAEAGTGALIERLGRLGESLGLQAINASPIFTALASTGMPTLGELDVAAARGALEEVEQAMVTFATKPIAGERGKVVAAELHAACGLAHLGLRRLLGDDPAQSEITAAIEAQRSAWQQSSRPGGLDDSLGKLRLGA